MRKMNRDALVGLLRLVILLPFLVFVPAGTVHYWQGWTCILVFSVCATLITLHLMASDPALLARRLKAGAKAETRRSQKLLQAFAALFFLSIFIVPALDRRFGLSVVPLVLELVGDLLITAGFIFVFWVFRANSFTSAVIEVATDQRVITTGPYAIVRHPMYLGALVLLLGIPLSLGSWWGLLTIVPIAVVIVARLLDEERFLVANLAEYDDYTKRVHYRLTPFVW